MYILFYTLGVLLSSLSIWYFTRIQIKELIPYTVYVYIIGLLGSRLLSLLEFNSLPSITLNQILDERSGLTFYGGYIPIFILTIFTLIKLSKDKNITLNKIFSIVIIIFHFGYAIGRLGCHFSADGCYGKFTLSSLGMRYTWGVRPTLFPVYPTPLFESIFNSGLGLFFIFVYFKYKNYNSIIILSFLIFPISRFFIEFIRNNEIYKWHLTLNQIISITLLLPQLFIFSIIRKKSYNEKTIDYSHNYNGVII